MGLEFFLDGLFGGWPGGIHGENSGVGTYQLPPRRTGDVAPFCADPTLAHKVLGYFHKGRSALTIDFYKLIGFLYFWPVARIYKASKRPCHAKQAEYSLFYGRVI